VGTVSKISCPSVFIWTHTGNKKSPLKGFLFFVDAEADTQASIFMGTKLKTEKNYWKAIS